MDNAERNYLASMQRELGELRRIVMGIPARWAGGGPNKLQLLQIIDGQTVYDNGMGTVYYGIQLYGGILTSLPSAYNPDISQTPGAFTATAGVGRALIWTNGGFDPVPVLVLLDGNSPIPNLLFDGDEVETDTKITLPVGAGPVTRDLYIPKFQ